MVSVDGEIHARAHPLSSISCESHAGIVIAEMLFVVFGEIARARSGKVRVNGISLTKSNIQQADVNAGSCSIVRASTRRRAAYNTPAATIRKVERSTPAQLASRASEVIS